MPRIDKQMLKTQSGSFTVGSRRTVADEKMEMTVFQTDADIFVQFVSDVYDSIETEHAAVAPGGQPMLFTKEEFVSYAFTAMCARVRYVSKDHSMINGVRFEVRCDDAWAMPAGLAAVINSVGRVVNESPVVTIEPVWNHEYDKFILTTAAWHRVSQRIRAVAKIQGMKLILVSQLSKDKTGDDMLMSLIPVRDELGRIVQIGHMRADVDPIAAALYIISGFDPEIYAGVNLALPAMLLPPFFVTVAEVRQNLWRITDAA